jgi:hypothetical protein
MTSATHQAIVEVYLADLAFPATQVSFADVRVRQFLQPTRNYSGVLGRDVMDNGAIRLDGRTRELILSF